MIETPLCSLRPWSVDDVNALVAIANDAEVARYLTDGFPHPYTSNDAREWTNARLCDSETTNFAIVADGVLAGGIGYDRYSNERRLGAHFGYWLGRRFWGRGIATAACAAAVDHAFATSWCFRLEATVYAPNVASARVLEKCGFIREGILRRAVIKEERIHDAFLYARVR